MKSKLNKPKLTWTAAAVITFIIIFFVGRGCEAAELGFGLGFGAANSVNTVTQDITIYSNSLKWYGTITLVGGSGVLKDNVRLTAGYRLLFRRDYNIQPYMKLGTAWWKDPPEPLVSERLMFDMAVGIRAYNVVELELLNHNSTADRSARNRGFDQILIRGVFEF